ncbi:MAG: DUF4167 domain-containing protein [Sphingomicrobium sp.]
MRQGNTRLINNRQGGRRRGRGGQRPQGVTGNSGNNARDNRQRGNAAQLLEKYKGMARDAQLAGDRVLTEYYLQFADHYFRVLEEGRSRFEEQQQPQRGRGRDDEDEDDGDGDGDSDNFDTDLGDDDSEPQQQRQQPSRQQPQQLRQRPDRNDERPERPRRDLANGRDDRPADNDQRIAAAVLPPAIGTESDNESPAEARPRRRVRKARDEDGGDIAPTA